MPPKLDLGLMLLLGTHSTEYSLWTAEPYSNHIDHPHRMFIFHRITVTLGNPQWTPRNWYPVPTP